jgi:hypothetical protein
VQKAVGDIATYLLHAALYQLLCYVLNLWVAICCNADNSQNSTSKWKIMDGEEDKEKNKQEKLFIGNVWKK